MKGLIKGKKIMVMRGVIIDFEIYMWKRGKEKDGDIKFSYKRIINDERIYEWCGNEYKKNEKIGK